MCSRLGIDDSIAWGLYCSELIAHQLLFDPAFAIDDTSIIGIDSAWYVPYPPVTAYMQCRRRGRGARLTQHELLFMMSRDDGPA
jgi:hypothetical protein